MRPEPHRAWIGTTPVATRPVVDDMGIPTDDAVGRFDGSSSPVRPPILAHLRLARRGVRMVTPILLAATAAGCDGLFGPSLPSDSRLEFRVPVDHVVANRSMPKLGIELTDGRGVRLDRSEGKVRLRLLDDGSGATLLGTTAVTPERGLAVFSDLTIDRPARDLVLEASYEEAPVARSNAFSSVQTPDLIRVHGASPDPDAGPIGFLVDGRSASGFTDDRVLVSDEPFAEVILERAGASNEVAVFQKGRAPGLVPDAAWTEGVDTVDVTLRDPFTLPVTVWYIAGGGGFEEERPRIERAFEEAQAMYDGMALGLDVASELEIVDASGFPRAADYTRTPFEGDDVVSDIGRREGRINVYGVRSIQAGLASARANHPTATATFTSDGWEGWVVAHELGHLFALRHPSLVAGFDAERAPNLMSTRQADTFTHGQVFYIHFTDRSAINRTYGLRTHHARVCPNEVAHTDDPGCPSLDLQLW